MSAEFHGVIADWLHARGIEDNDGFAKRAASAMVRLQGWQETDIRAVFNRTRTDLFRRNSGFRKVELCAELARHVLAKCKPTNEEAELRPELCKIVFFASNPPSTTRLDLAEEIRDITQKIRAAKYRETIDLVTAWATRPDDLLQYLNEHDATIVHFSGHGSGTPGLMMQNDAGQPTLVEADALEALFKTQRGNVRLVVLNACDSIAQAKAIAKEIDFVVGMRSSIGDEAARIFAASLYRAIGFGRSIQDAFDEGKAALMLNGIREEVTPVLIVRRGVSASSIKLVG